MRRGATAKGAGAEDRQSTSEGVMFFPVACVLIWSQTQSAATECMRLSVFLAGQ